MRDRKEIAEEQFPDSKTALFTLMEVLAVKETLSFMDTAKQKHHSFTMPRCICRGDMEDYEFDEAALSRLEAKLLHNEEYIHEGKEEH